MTREEARSRLGELSKACTRLGATSYQVAEWLLRFAQVDLSALSEGEWLNLLSEIHAFVFYQGRHYETDTETLVGCRRNWEGGPCISRNPEDENLSAVGMRELIEQVQARTGLLYSALPSRKQVGSLQGDLLRTVGRLGDKKGAIVSMPAIRKAVYPWPATKVHPEFIQIAVFCESPQELFRLAVQEHLAPEFASIRRCPECQKIFLRGRSDQGFCSKPCQVRTAVRRLRKTPAHRIGKRGRPVGSTASKKKGSKNVHPKN